METHTFISILAWIVCIHTGLIVLLNTNSFLRLRVTTKGWIILLLFILGLYWILCK